MQKEFLVLQEKIYKQFDDINLKDFNIFLAVSGGSDSMFMFYLIEEYFSKKNLDTKNINILHFNHKYREESEKEYKYLKNYFSKNNFIYGEYSGTVFTEKEFRNARYDFFAQNISKLSIEGKDSLLCLGHNLDDRIETTILNMARGCSLDGFLNMDFFSDGFVNKINQDLKNKIKIFRPLINIPKFKIKSFCNFFEIPYFEDATNEDNTMSQRNFVRNEIISRIASISNKDKNGIPKFYDSFNVIYQSLSSHSIEPNLQEIKVSPEREVSYAYKWKVENITISNFVGLLKYLGIYFDISQTMLQEMTGFLQNSRQGYKYLNSVYFFKSHGKIYIIKGNVNFRQKKLAHIKKINKIGICEIGSTVVNIDQPEYIGGTLRFAQTGDVYRSKKITRYFINQKIPVFWRNFIPIIVLNGKIEKIFIDIIK